MKNKQESDSKIPHQKKNPSREQEKTSSIKCYILREKIWELRPIETRTQKEAKMIKEKLI